MCAGLVSAAPLSLDNSIYLPVLHNGHDRGQWEVIATNGEPTPRHENGFVRVDDRFYLVGGRGIKPTNVYDPVSNSWSERGDIPFEMHHLQAAAFDGKIYIVGAWTGGFPYEDNIDRVQIYDPQTDNWTEGMTIPPARNRGSAGSAVYNDKIYIVGGNVGGHGPHATTVHWFDVYDPVNDTWQVLPDMPHERDHFNVAIIGDKLYAAGGRISGSEDFPQNTVGEVDMYDFTTGVWTTLPYQLNYERGGSMTAVLDGKLFVTGGEGFGQAWGETELLQADNKPWQILNPLNLPRHASQLIEYDNGIYVVGGAGTQGGAPELPELERFALTAD